MPCLRIFVGEGMGGRLGFGGLFRRFSIKGLGLGGMEYDDMLGRQAIVRLISMLERLDTVLQSLVCRDARL